MTDDEFLHALECCTLPNHAFGHREHLRLAWLYLRRMSHDAAVTAMERSIRRYAARHGAANKYHHTMTLVWMNLVASALVSGGGDVDDFASFLQAHPALLDRDAPRRFFSAERLDSPAARTGWVEPDLAPLPRVVAHRTLS